MANFPMNLPPYFQGMRQPNENQKGPFLAQNRIGFPGTGFRSPESQHNPPSCFPLPASWNRPHFSQPPPSSQNQHNRLANNVWCDPSLYYPRPGCPNYANGRPPHGQHHGSGRYAGRVWNRHGGFDRGGKGRGGHHYQQGQNNNSFNKDSDLQKTKNMQADRGNLLLGQNMQKVKANKRDLPENNAFHCEVCDRGFKTKEKFQEHTNEHIQCSVKGCRYVAAPKLVQLHYQLQHRTGLANKIWSLESPEDIKKWIQERKRNFPTKETIARKARETRERRGRGEMIETKQFGKMRGRGRGRRGHFIRQNVNSGSGPWQSSVREELNQDTSESQKVDKSHPSHCSNNSHQNLSHQHSATNGASSCLEHDDNTAGQKRHLQTDETHLNECSTDIDTAPSSKKSKQESDHCKAENTEMKKGSYQLKDPLALLLDGGDDSSENDDDDDRVDVKPGLLAGKGLASLISSYQSNSSDENSDAKEYNGKELTKPVDHSAQQSFGTRNISQESETPPKRQNKHQIAKHTPQPKRNFKKSTLLEMLLASEIRHERNVILQCVYYIVRNKFLGVCDGNRQ